MTILRSGYAPPNRRNLYGYATAHWQAIRRQRLAYDMGTCTLKLDGCTLKATTVHLDPSLNGDHSKATLHNTRSACRHCHGVVDGAGARTPLG